MNWISPSSITSVRLGADHGYVVDGDVARLHADVEFFEPVGDSRWALQLWACDAPHASGPLAGIKVAEADLTGSLDGSLGTRRLSASAQALLPGGRRDHAMVLVLASGRDGRYDQVHDFANYPARQAFATPHFDGAVGYRIDGDELWLQADAIRNPRSEDNVSGTLSLELWAVNGPYGGGPFDGFCLGRVELGRLAGRSELSGVSERVPFAAPPAGSWNVVVMLREWVGGVGYLTRDHSAFAVSYVADDAAPAAREAVVDAPVEAPREAAFKAPEAKVEAPAAAPKASASAAGVAVNRATVNELSAIKGLSRPVAAEIVRRRPFTSLDGLLEVKGIGPKLLAKLRPFLTLE